MTAVSSPRKQANSGLSVLRPQRAGVVYALVVVVVAFQVLALSKGLPAFLSVTNVRNIIDQSALDGVLVISMTVLLITGNFDLSVGATAGLAGAAGLTVANSHGILLGTLTAIGIGLGIGIVNGVLVQVVGVNAFIVTLGMLTAVQGLLLIVTSTNTVLAKSGQFSSLGTVLRAFSPPVMIAVGVVLVLYAVARAMGKIGPRRAEPRTAGPRTAGPRFDGTSASAGVVGLIIIVGIAVFPALTTETTESWIMLVYMVLASLVLRFTIVGRRVYAVGGNAEAARLSGINVGRYKIGAFVLTSVSAGLVGLMYAGKFGAVEPTALVNEELPVLAAAILGGTSLFGGSGYVLKSVVGALILASLTEGFNVLNLGANYQYLVQGVVIIAAAAVYTVAGQRRRATVTSGGQPPAPGAGAGAGADAGAGAGAGARDGSKPVKSSAPEAADEPVS
ncbi:MAG TPA: ABC transporter permease [Trebonia sp.]|nr:ABC transporter permease [Trebonia sp.]